MGARDIIRMLSGGLIQQGRLLKLDTPVGANVLLPQRVVARSRLGRQYDFTVDVISTSAGIELKGLIAQSVTLWVQQSDASYLPHHGYVHTARRLGSDSGLTSYQIVFAPWLHFLRFRQDARIWQDKSADEILTDVFKMHPQARGAFRFDLQKQLASRSFCVQYEDDWSFVHRLMEAEGLYGYFEQATDGQSHTLVIVNSTFSLPALSPRTVSFYRADTCSEADGFVQWGGTRTLQSSALTTRTFDYKSPSPTASPKGTSISTLHGQGNLPRQTEVYEYTGAYTFGEQERGDQLSKVRMEEWESQAKRFYGAGAVRRVDVGRWFELTDHPEHDGDSEHDRQFAIIETAWFIENNLPVPSYAPDFPHSLKHELAAKRAAPAVTGQTHIVRHADGSVGFFLIEIEAQRRAVPYHSPLEHHKPVMYLQTATVAGPANEEVHTDALNRIKVRMHWDRLNDGDEKASCWVRAAYSDTGGGYGAVHIPRIGEEVIIDWVGGDCDRPIVTGRVYNGATKPQWHSNGLLSGYRSKEYQGSGYNELVMDDATGQNRTRLHSSSTNAYLQLGYLIEQTGNIRGRYLGNGFELKSDAYGAISAGKGLYLSTHPATGGTAQQLEVRQAQQQLVNTESVLEVLSEASATHQAGSLKDGYDALKAFTEATQCSISGATSGGRTAGGGTGNANAFGQPVMLFASPSGIALSTQQTAHVAADEQLNIVSGQSAHIATGRSLIASVAQSISLFAQNAGMKLFAAKGNVEIRAHADNVELTAQKTVKLLSATEKIEIAAKQEILLTSGGAHIRIAGGNIEIHAPGKIDIKGSQHSLSGPTQSSYDLPVLPNGDLHNKLELNLADDSLRPVPNAPYKVMFENGGVMSGKLDANGYAVLHDVPPGPVKAFFGEDARPFTRAPLPEAKDLGPDDVLKELHAAGHDETTHDNLASLFNRFSGRPDLQ